MTHVSLTVNGRQVSADVAPRTHLADFLREQLLLTGTHLGCEQGVCGACTVLLDNAPARSCLTLTALCDGADIRTVEGLTDDGLGTALREAFTAEHALQCGYCTPGFLVTARDIIRRLPDANEDRIRLELAGNLCRCTGYNGIVRAIRRVMESGVTEVVAPPAPVAAMAPVVSAPAVATVPAPQPQLGRTTGTSIHQTLRMVQPAAAVWTAIQDPVLVAGCVPGAAITAQHGDQIEGELHASLGPIHARFTGTAFVTYDAATRSGRIVGQGQDKGGGTRLSAEAAFVVEPDGPDASLIRLDITYDLRGRLAQFSRGAVVQVFAAEIAATVAENLNARLSGQELPKDSPMRMISRVLRLMMRRWLKRTDA